MPRCVKNSSKRVRKIKKWQFDKQAAENFATIARREIPDYQRVIDLSIRIIQRLNIENPKIIDVGSATGATLHALYEAGFKNLYGVDSSAEMLARSFDKATLIESERFPAEHGPFDVVIANWVLHFIHDRDKYLDTIKRTLSQNGVLILTDKVSGSPLANELYHDFKRLNGMSEEQIEEKKQRLEGVLTTKSLKWYLDKLGALGFRQIDVVSANTVFVSLLAQQGGE